MGPARSEAHAQARVGETPATFDPPPGAEVAASCRVARGERGTFLARRRHALHSDDAYLRVATHGL